MKTFAIGFVIIWLLGSLNAGKHKHKRIARKKQSLKHILRGKKLIEEKSETKSTIFVPITTPDDGGSLPSSFIGQSPPFLAFDGNVDKIPAPAQNSVNTKPIDLENIYKSIFGKNANEGNTLFGGEKEEDEDKDEIIAEDNEDDDDDDVNVESEKLELYKNLLYNKELLANAVIRKYYDKLIKEPSGNPNAQQSADLGMEGGTIQRVVQDVTPQTAGSGKQKAVSRSIQQNKANTIEIQTPTTSVLNPNVPLVNYNSALNTYIHDTKPAPIFQQIARPVAAQQPESLYDAYAPINRESAVNPLLQGRTVINSDNVMGAKEGKKSPFQATVGTESNELPGKIPTLIDSGTKQAPYVDKTGLHLNYEYERNNFKLKDIWRSANKAQDLYNKIQSMDENLINYLSDTGKTLANYLDKKKKLRAISKHGNKSHKNQKTRNKSKRIKLFSYLLDRIKNMTEKDRENVFNKLSAIVSDNQRAKNNSTSTVQDQNNKKNETTVNKVNILNNGTTQENKSEKNNDSVMLQKTMKKIDILMEYLLASDKSVSNHTSLNPLNNRTNSILPLRKDEKYVDPKKNTSPKNSALITYTGSIKKPSVIENFMNKSQIRYISKTNFSLRRLQQMTGKTRSSPTKLSFSKQLSRPKFRPNSQYRLSDNLIIQNSVNSNIKPFSKNISLNPVSLTTDKYKHLDGSKNNSLVNISHTKTKIDNILKAKNFGNELRPKHFRNVIIETDDSGDSSFTGSNVFVWKNHNLKNIKNSHNKHHNSKNIAGMKLEKDLFVNFDEPSDVVPANKSASNPSTLNITKVDASQLNELKVNITNKLCKILKSVQANISPINISTDANTTIKEISNNTFKSDDSTKAESERKKRLRLFLEDESLLNNETKPLEKNNTAFDVKENQTKTFFRTKENINEDEKTLSFIQQRNINESWKEEIASQLQNFFKNILVNTKKKVLIPRTPNYQVSNTEQTEKKIHIAKPFNATKGFEVAITKHTVPVQTIVQPNESQQKNLNETLAKLVPIIPIPLLQTPSIKNQLTNMTLLLKDDESRNRSKISSSALHDTDRLMTSFAISKSAKKPHVRNSTWFSRKPKMSDNAWLVKVVGA